MQSNTKATIAERHQGNTLLNAGTLPPMRQSAGDLSTEHPSPRPEAAIVERAGRALDEGQTHYVDVPGIGPLREQLAAYLVEMGLSSCMSDNVLVTAGVQEGRFISIQIVGTEYGAIALPAVVHPGAKQAIGVRPLDTQELPVEASTGFLPTIAGIRTALESGCKLLYLESPVRLTGAVFDTAAVREIAGLIEQFDAAAIWDQGLAPWVEQGRYSSLGAQSGMDERVVVLGEAWPGMGLESWLIGYVGAKADWLEAMRSQKQIMSICTSTASQYAALEAGKHYAQVHEGQFEQLLSTRQTATEIATRLGARPVAGATVNLIALQITDGENMRTELQNAGYDVAPGATFGAPDILRLRVTLDDALTNALEALI